MKNLITYGIFLSAIILSGCNKVKSEKWLVAEIEAIDAYTGEPVQCHVRLFYTSDNGTVEHILYLGETTEDGKFCFERKIEKGDGNFDLNLYTHSELYTNASNPQYETLDLEVTSENKLTALFESLNFYTVSIRNINCAGPNDSLFIKPHNGVLYNWIFTGCVDTTIITDGNSILGSFTSICLEPVVTLDYIVKRGSQVDQFSQSVTLIPKQIVPVEINY
jgi:hypothetical protein